MKRLRPLLAALFLSVPLSAAVSGRLISTSEADPSWVAKARASYPLNVCVVSDEELQRMKAEGPLRNGVGKAVPYPFRNAKEMLAMAARRAALSWGAIARSASVR